MEKGTIRHVMLPPFNETLFSRLATGYPERVVTKVRQLLLATDKIHRNPGKLFPGRRVVIGGRPPGVSPMPDADDLEAESKLYWADRDARRSEAQAFEVFIEKEAPEVQEEARLRYYRLPVEQAGETVAAGRHELVPRRQITESMLKAREVIIRYLTERERTK